MKANIIDQNLCTRCGRCVDLCPAGIYYRRGDTPTAVWEDRTTLCMACGQCMAVCPTKAVTAGGLDYERDFFEFESPDDSSFFGLIERRRSVRFYSDRPVTEETLGRIVEAISFAPPGFTPLKTELSVIADPDIMKEALPHMVAVYDGLLRALKNPIARLMIRRTAGKDTYRVLANHVVPLMTMRMPALKSGAEDTITRGAPAMVLFHAHHLAENRKEDAFIALAYGLLAAHSLGLGAVALSLVPAAVERSRELRVLFRVPDENEVLASMVVGYPVHKYRRGIRRRLRRVEWIVPQANDSPV